MFKFLIEDIYCIFFFLIVVKNIILKIFKGYLMGISSKLVIKFF